MTTEAHNLGELRSPCSGEVMKSMVKHFLKNFILIIGAQGGTENYFKNQVFALTNHGTVPISYTA